MERLGAVFVVFFCDQVIVFCDQMFKHIYIPVHFNWMSRIQQWDVHFNWMSHIKQWDVLLIGCHIQQWSAGQANWRVIDSFLPSAA